MIPLIAFTGLALADEAMPPTVDDRLRALVNAPTETLLADPSAARGFRIIALSNAAEACLRRAQSGAWPLEEARVAVARLASTAADERFHPFTDLEGPYGDHNLYVTHWLLVLTSLAKLDPLHVEVRRLDGLARHLEARSLDHPSGIARSFPVTEARWPADQTATLHALFEVDLLLGSTYAAGPRARFAEAIATQASTIPGLPVSEWTGEVPFHDRPRGTALAWSVRHLSDVLPELANQWWTAGKPVFESEGLGMRGFREWPEGDDHPADRDSGPILLGMSAAATAFAVGASRAVDDCEAHLALVTTQRAVEKMVQDPETASTLRGTAALVAVQQSPLAAAITANVSSVPTRCPPVPLAAAGAP